MSAGQSIVFRFRGLWFGLIFWMGFFLYSVDRQNVIDFLGKYAGARCGWNVDATDRAMLWAAAFSCVLAALLRTWASAYLSSSVVHDVRLHSERLVADGPYRRVRNPLYLGNVLLSIGFGLMANRIGALVIFFGNLVIVLLLIRREEAALLAGQGESFAAYRARVPRLLPALAPRVPPAGGKANWANGVRTELYMWCFALGLVGFAASRGLVFFYAGCGLGVLALLVEGTISSRRSRHSPAAP